jgi:hypothetical protein
LPEQSAVNVERRRIDPFLAGALRADGGAWPDELAGVEDQAAEAAIYHGVCGLLVERTGVLATWPASLAGRLRADAVAHAMWEMRHRHVLSRLLPAVASAGIRCALMKGTALAYDLYPQPSLRPRADSDLLVAPRDVDAIRAILTAQGFVPFFGEAAAPDAGRSQEPWSLAAPDGSSHDVDLHWQVLNGAALEAVLPTDEVLADAVALPRLCPSALALSRPHGFLLACLHRAQHILTPYFIDGEAHYGGDRLIWLYDIGLLTEAMTPADWAAALDRAEATGAATVCRSALADAARLLGTRVPDDVLARLGQARDGAASNYLLHSGRTERALADLRALGWRRALRHGSYRFFPPPEFLRMQYPLSRLPLPLLYLRRMGRFLAGGRQ